MRQFVYQIAMMLIGSIASANGLKIDKEYMHSDDHSLRKDTACIQAVEQNITPNFRGLRTLAIRSSHVLDTSSGTIAIYPEVTFSGDYGNAKGSMYCLFGPDKHRITDVAVVFLGLGLGGFEPRGRYHPSKDPSKWKVSSFAHQLAK
ncbi:MULTISPECIES: hypothetical protein [Mameliella]|uniref:hypothetical protein n=1 Tax=Mameliella TaxID=1434019 RepID=UPI000B538924|nr:MULTISPECIES: hypothetical protein [Mameliella]MCR9271744.1 hypothetical protein [Paracoccaceae bacterium]OWV60822.1 hypothetical protein CDZ98_07155 [Mameliella alba]